MTLRNAVNFAVLALLLLAHTLSLTVRNLRSFHSARGDVLKGKSDGSFDQKPGKILVLGGTGFIGREIVKRARQRGYVVVSLSRRGRRSDETDNSVSWVSGDAAQEKVVRAVLQDFGPFDACIHCIGLLLDSDSGLSAFNKFASGSGSQPTLDSTYDRITRQTAFAAIDSFADLKGELDKVRPFVFISAAEAGWTFPTPFAWLERYLEAKRAVEKKLLESAPVGLKPVVLRPSLIWTPSRPQALVSVLPFYVGHALRMPFIDKPVRLEALADAALAAVTNPEIRGILRFNQIEEVAAKLQ